MAIIMELRRIVIRDFLYEWNTLTLKKQNKKEHELKNLEKK